MSVCHCFGIALSLFAESFFLALFLSFLFYKFHVRKYMILSLLSIDSFTALLQSFVLGPMRELL